MGVGNFKFHKKINKVGRKTTLGGRHGGVKRGRAARNAQGKEGTTPIYEKGFGVRPLFHFHTSTNKKGGKRKKEGGKDGKKRDVILPRTPGSRNTGDSGQSLMVRN